MLVGKELNNTKQLFSSTEIKAIFYKIYSILMFIAHDNVQWLYFKICFPFTD